MNTCRSGFGCDVILVHLLWRVLFRTGASLLHEKITMKIADLASNQPNITIAIASGAEGTLHL
jgi:hypothetical protein